MPKVTGNIKSSCGKWLATTVIGGKRYETQMHSAWSNMRGRCRKNTKHQISHPTYIGCSILPEWEDFQNFAEWYSSQVGFEVRGEDDRVFQLDKDILFKGNKVYGPDTCVLIPSQLNSFFIDCGAQRGKYPQGVSYFKGGGKFRSYIRDEGKYVHLGLFRTVGEAEKVYLEAKGDMLVKWIEKLDSQSIVDDRVVSALKQLLH